MRHVTLTEPTFKLRVRIALKSPISPRLKPDSLTANKKQKSPRKPTDKNHHWKIGQTARARSITAPQPKHKEASVESNSIQLRRSPSLQRAPAAPATTILLEFSIVYQLSRGWKRNLVAAPGQVQKATPRPRAAVSFNPLLWTVCGWLFTDGRLTHIGNDRRKLKRSDAVARSRPRKWPAPAPLRAFCRPANLVTAGKLISAPEGAAKGCLLWLWFGVFAEIGESVLLEIFFSILLNVWEECL